MSPGLAGFVGFLAGFGTCAVVVLWAVAEAMQRLERDSRPSDGGEP